MSFKPIDIQVNISQINHVARAQQQQRLQPLLDQAAHAAHIRKEGDAKQHIVEPKGQAGNEESTVKWRKHRENGGEGERKGERERKPYSGDKPEPSRMVIRESDTPEKGGYIDTRR